MAIMLICQAVQQLEIHTVNMQIAQCIQVVTCFLSCRRKLEVNHVQCTLCLKTIRYLTVTTEDQFANFLHC